MRKVLLHIHSLQGVTLTARAIRGGPQFIDDTNTRSIGGWTRWDAGARLKKIIARHPAIFKMSIQSLFNKSYRASGSLPAAATLLEKPLS